MSHLQHPEKLNLVEETQASKYPKLEDIVKGSVVSTAREITRQSADTLCRGFSL